MITGLRALTSRGRSFLASGVAALLCAFVFGEHDLLRVAVLIIALPLLAAMVVARTRYRLACARRLSPARVEVGSDSTVTLRLENVTRLPTGLLLVEDNLQYALGARPRFVLDRVEPRGVREIDYKVRSDLRGRFSIGPLSIRITDPFGLVELARSFTITDTLVVIPEVVPLPRVRLSGEWAGGGESRTRSVAAAGDDDVAPREYRQGDELVVADEADIVYRQPGPPLTVTPGTLDMPPVTPAREPYLRLTADPTLLFRFSALTYNAHRIHYDLTWCRVEGYPDLVVHGPLQALLMGELIRRHGGELIGRTFAYRLRAPMIGPQTFTVIAAEDGIDAGAEVRDVHDTVTATATLVPATAG